MPVISGDTQAAEALRSSRCSSRATQSAKPSTAGALQVTIVAALRGSHMNSARRPAGTGTSWSGVATCSAPRQALAWTTSSSRSMR